MNNKVNYTVVGLAVLLGFTLIFGFTYWLLKPSSAKEITNYNIYFDESVLGLNLDAPVKYRGISVGKVINLKINPENSEQVQVLVAILKSTPIKENTVAKLTSQGITGLSYINLSLGDNDAPPLVAKEGNEYPVIKTVPSFFENFEKSLGSVSTKVSKTLTKTEELLNEDNQKQFALLLENSANTMEKVDRLLDDKTIKSLQNSAKNLERITYKVNAVMPNIDNFITKSVSWEEQMGNSFDDIKNTYKSMGVTMNNMAKSFQDATIEVQSMSGELTPTVNKSIIELQGVMIKLQDVMNQYERSPSDILFKEEEAKKGPGEE